MAVVGAAIVAGVSYLFGKRDVLVERGLLGAALGATVGDFLDKPLDHGGLDLSRPLATTVVGVAILALILLLPQRAGNHPARA